MKGPAAPRAPLPAWFDGTEVARHDDLTERIVLPGDDADWVAASVPGIEVRVLEYIVSDQPRLTAQVRLAAGFSEASLGPGADLEIFLQSGSVATADDSCSAGCYVRLPVTGDERVDELILRAPDTDDAPRAMIYVATGHIASSDTERRIIDTNDASCWLPGPIDGTEVLPLHGHGSGNVMMIRWLGTMAFKPRLDPLGEEVLVITGCLHDADGSYPAGSWIRNPVPSWQSWSADAGTQIYYKNGHFATTRVQDD